MFRCTIPAHASSSIPRLAAPRRMSRLDGTKASCATESLAPALTRTAFRASFVNLPAAVSFFFSDRDRCCLLCKEHSLAPDIHVQTPMHMAAEITLDVVLPSFLQSGKVSVLELSECWSQRLARSPLFQRITEWSVGVNLQQRREKLLDVLTFLANIGVVRASLCLGTLEYETGRRGIPFERLECIGDHCWGSSTSKRIVAMLPELPWDGAHSHLFDTLRCAVESNVNLERFYDWIGMDAIYGGSTRSSPSRIDAASNLSKSKSDIVEAVVGELYVALWSKTASTSFHDPYCEGKELSVLVHHALAEINDLFLLHAVVLHLDNVTNVLQRFVAMQLWAKVPPLVQDKKQRRTFSSHRSPTQWTLPSVTLHDQRVVGPCTTRVGEKGPYSIRFCDTATQAAPTRTRTLCADSSFSQMSATTTSCPVNVPQWVSMLCPHALP